MADDQGSQERSVSLSAGDLILKKDLLRGSLIEYEFIKLSDEKFTCQARRISDDQLEWINLKQIQTTGRRVEHQKDQPAQGKKRTWTLGVDPIPDEHIKKRKSRR